ncbi:MAG: TetR/AcrR family transcriptional regulator [Gemmatimonadetes bacterium]|nr:TetR/AcrR family transcriptional regulator [Gemmatimonadota bacterium]
MSGNAHLNSPKQARSRRTLERIIQAALEILEVDGSSALTVQAVVERANSSVGSFYARFSGKEDLLDYLAERVWHQTLDRWNDALSSRDWSRIDLQHIAEGSIRLLVDAGKSRSVYMRALDRAKGRDGVAYDTFRSRVIGDVAEILLARRDEIAHPEPELAVRLGLLATAGMIEADRSADDGPLPREILVSEATNLLLRYLTVSTSASAQVKASEEVDFFDIWG